MINVQKLLRFALLCWLLLLTAALFGQAQINAGIDINAPNKPRLAVPDFKGTGTDPNAAALQKVFNDTLWNDLDQAGIFDVVSKSLYPTTIFGSPEELCGALQGCPGMAAWANAPASANMVTVGNIGIANNQLAVAGWVLDAKNVTAPPILGKEYHGDANEQTARLIAHEFADAIIQRLGGGLPGIAESHIYFIHSNGPGSAKELWMMDYDGSNQRQLTHLNSIALSPAVSPDGTRVAFTSFARGNPQIAMYSVELNRVITFPRFGGTNDAASWSPDGTKLAFFSSMPPANDAEIYVCEVSDCKPRRVTAYRGPDTQPVWNPKTGAQIIWVSSRASDPGKSVPQIYEMAADGTNVQRITNEGYAVSPAWEPTQGAFLAFSWDRRYGPGAPGSPDIYIMDLANTSRWEQLTHNGGRNDYPTWSPDGRHIAYQSKPGRACEQIWTMLANGQKPTQITHSGCNTQPSWGK